MLGRIRDGQGLVRNSEKTVCPQGHAYDEANTFRYRGYRYCRTCHNEQKRERNRQRPGPTHRSILMQILWKRDGGLCRYCGAPATEVDHVVPVCRNGSQAEICNTVLSCHDCNATKGREGGFTLSKKNVLRWQGTLVDPGALFGAPLMELVKEQRLRRQQRQGLTHLVEYSKKNKKEVHHE